MEQKTPVATTVFGMNALRQDACAYRQKPG